MDFPEREVERLLEWKIGVIALVLGAIHVVLALLFPNSGEWSAVLLGWFMLVVFGVAFAGFVASAFSAFDFWARERALVAMLMNVAAAALPFVAWLLHLIIYPR